MYTLLHGHVSPETAYTKDNYPYGRKTTMARWWIETNKRGQQRMVRQTQNPNTLEWNKPHLGIYGDLVFLYRDEVTGHIHRWDLNYTDAVGIHFGRFVACGLFSQLTEEEKKAVRLLYFASCKINPNSDNEWRSILNYIRENPEEEWKESKKFTVAKAQVNAEDHQVYSVCPW